MPRSRATLYDYQHDLMQAWEASEARRVLLVLPTGTGKTHVAAAIIRKIIRRGGRVLFLAHRRELIEQAYRRVRAAGVAARRIGVVMGGERSRRNNAAPVQIASIDAYRRNPAGGTFDVVFVDEAHRAPSKSYQEVLALYPKARIVGLTATPQRLDGKALGDVFDELIEGPPPRDLIARGRLALARIFTVPDEELPRMLGVRVLGAGSDYVTTDLEERVSRPEICGSVVRDWLARANGVPTVVFAVSVAHAHKLAWRFRRAKVATEIVTGTTPTDERAAMLARVASGQTTVIVNCEILTEGWDAPNIRCVVMARPTLSDTLYMQQVGRALRPGDIQPIILDHAGNVRRHGVPEDHFDWELTKSRPRGGSGAQARTCPSCFAIMPLGSRECPVCGAEMPAPNAREEPLENGVPLVDLARANGIPIRNVYKRITVGWDRKRAVETPVEGRHPRGEILKATQASGLSAKTIRGRLTKGMSLDEAITAPRARAPRVRGVWAAARAAGLAGKTVLARMKAHNIGVEAAIAMGPAKTPEQCGKIAGAASRERALQTDSTAKAARDAGLNPQMVRERMRRLGISVQEAVLLGPATPREECGRRTSAKLADRYANSINAKARAAGFRPPTIHARMKQHGITAEEAIALGPAVGNAATVAELKSKQS